MSSTLADCVAHVCVYVCLSVGSVGLLAAIYHKINFKYFGSLNVLMSLHSTARVRHRQWGFYWGRGAGRGWSPPPKLSLRHPLVYAWMIQNFINILIFRVRPCAYYVKGTMKGQKSIYSKFI